MVILFFLLCGVEDTFAVQKVGKFKTHELWFESSNLPKNPFDTYLLSLEITDPKGNKFTIDGFFDGDGKGGQDGKIWKARICPYETGMWTWKTVTGDKFDNALAGLKGQFTCVESGDLGGIVADKQYFRLQNGGYIYLQGNFLDFSHGLRTTHVYMSETTTDIQREAIIRRQIDFHNVNKINIYIANKGDYKGKSVTPWVGNALKNDKSTMDLSRWKKYDRFVRYFKDNGLLAEIWFFADDSGFGKLPQEDKNRLFRYAMARTSAFSNTLYVIALEWAEGWSKSDVSISGEYIQEHNPWRRLLSVHNITPKKFSSFFSLRNIAPRKFLKLLLFIPKNSHWAFSGEKWASFIATQPGNSSREVNKLAIKIRRKEQIPHIGEEFGVLRINSDKRLRSKMWANFCGGASGAGTGSDIRAFMNFLEQSKIPFNIMVSANKLVQRGGTNRFCLAEEGHHYIVYSQEGKFDLSVQGQNLKGFWFNPRNPKSKLGNYFLVQTGTNTFEPPNDISKDWVLWITDQSNLGQNSIYPSRGSTLTREIINGSLN